MGLYLDTGYLNIDYIMSTGSTFVFIVGGRGTGKTYGMIDYWRRHNIPSIYMRRSERQIRMACRSQLSPFAKYARDNGLGYEVRNVGDGVVEALLWDGVEERESDAVLLLPLSTMANMRGLDGDRYRLAVWDEFIPLEQERVLPSEDNAIFDAYETIARNRELSGGEPLKLVCCANSNNLLNPLFRTLGLIGVAEKMRERCEEVYIDKDRDLTLVLLQDSPISERKRSTALYRLTTGSRYEEMALDNKFSGNVRTKIESKDLRAFRPLCVVGEIQIYIGKSQRKFYVSSHKSGTCPHFSPDEVGLEKFRLHYGYLWYAYVEGSFTFERYENEAIFRLYFGKKY